MSETGSGLVHSLQRYLRVGEGFMKKSYTGWMSNKGKEKKKKNNTDGRSTDRCNLLGIML